jgi:hypothetical protein
MDQAWLYHYGPEIKQQSTEGRHSDSPRLAPKNLRVQKSVERFLACLQISKFCDLDVILLVVLLQLKDILKEKYRGDIIKWVLFLHDKPPA